MPTDHVPGRRRRRRADREVPLERRQVARRRAAAVARARFAVAGLQDISERARRERPFNDRRVDEAVRREREEVLFLLDELRVEVDRYNMDVQGLERRPRVVADAAGRPQRFRRRAAERVQLLQRGQVLAAQVADAVDATQSRPGRREAEQVPPRLRVAVVN